MIKLQDLPEPGFLLAPGNYDKWAEAQLAIAEEREMKCVRLHDAIGTGVTEKHWNEMDREVDDLTRNVVATILFAALEVEATLNFHGVVHLRGPQLPRQAHELPRHEPGHLRARGLLTVVRAATATRRRLPGDVRDRRISAAKRGGHHRIRSGEVLVELNAASAQGREVGIRSHRIHVAHAG
jgi:hypothetical protein